MGLGFGDLLVGWMWTCAGGRGEYQRLRGTSVSPAWSRPLDVTVRHSTASTAWWAGESALIAFRMTCVFRCLGWRGFAGPAGTAPPWSTVRCSHQLALLHEQIGVQGPHPPTSFVPQTPTLRLLPLSNHPGHRLCPSPPRMIQTSLSPASWPTPGLPRVARVPLPLGDSGPQVVFAKAVS